jgi:pyrimidine-specific ribonucleoside hydrolase
VFDYNYELDNKSMDVILESTIPLVFAGYEPSSILILGILIFASLDMSEEAKWLFDIVQPWMDKTRSILG